MTKRGSRPFIRLHGVRHNNLKNFDLDLPVGQLIVMTGLSGSGKSSLAFDTLFAEGQRRYIETFSPYARQFFDRMDKPQVDRIEGIPPAIAVEQTNNVRTTRSTVGTMTELCDYMKLLWSSLAQLYCRQCGRPVRQDSPQSLWEQVRAMGSAEVLVTFELPLSAKLPLSESLALVAKQGYQRLLLNNQVIRLEDALSKIDGSVPALTVIQDRVKVQTTQRARLVEACEQAYHFGKGKLAVRPLDASGSILSPHPYSKGLHCAPCDLEYREPTPALFSFNHPQGACPTCRGFGRIITIDYQLALPNPSKTLAEGVVKPWQTGQGAECQIDLLKFCKRRGIPTDVPFHQLSQDQQNWVVQGDPDYGKDEHHQWPRAWYGVKGYFRWLESKAYKMHVRVLLSRYRAYTPCPDCQGRRFQPESLLFQIRLREPIQKATRQDANLFPAGLFSQTLADFYALPIAHALDFIDLLARRHAAPATDPITVLLEEVRSRLGYLVDVGLGYLTLDRPTRTLSGGETERVNLTTCLGSRLVNTLFVLDEPSVGLHARDTQQLTRILQNLRDTGNTVVVVEHEAAIMRAADQIVDLGPGQGEAGGQIVFQGSLDQLLAAPSTLTGQYLSGVREATVRRSREVNARTPRLTLARAQRHNLQDLTVEIPLNRLVCLSGVSGSGKTTLAREVLLPALQSRLQQAATLGKASNRLDPTKDTKEKEETDAISDSAGHSTSVILQGSEHLARVILVDQSPLGRTPRSNPAVYVGAFDDIRELFAQTELARQRGLKSSAFSFNSPQGQCERCRGAGFEKIEMQFLSDVFIRCPDCDGRRYRPHILEIKLPISAPSGLVSSAPFSTPSSAWSIADLLEATVDDTIQALVPYVRASCGVRALRRLNLLKEVGLGYLRLGQPINTLSGGESQRLKLASHLAECKTDPGQDVALSGSRRGKKGDHSSHDSDPPATLFIFDEPTTGLHFHDVKILLEAFQRLVEAGHSLLVIEHNLDVIQSADWVIDLGPEGGAQGGRIVAQGTPQEIAANEASHTGRFLRGGKPTVLRYDQISSDPLPAATLAEASSPWRPAQVSAHSVSLKSREGRSAVRRGGKRSEDAMPMAWEQDIEIRGAREHNLKNLSLDIPRDKFVVVTGVSGSGKSTLAFDLLFAEGQRRFLDSMNTYARQFVEQMSRPDVDRITGIPPTVSIEQRTTRGGGKSTVATVTEIYHFLRLLFARLGKQYCPDCQLPVEAQTRDQVGRQLQQEMKRRGDLLLLAPVVRNRKGFHSEVAEWASAHGYREIRADGKLYDTAKPFRLDRFREHDVEIVVGVLDKGARRTKAGSRKVAAPAQALIDEALKLGRGTLFALDNAKQLTIHSTERACPSCGRSFPPLDPKMFSYNSAQGWCPGCRGFGELFYLPDVDRGANADAIEESWFDWQEGRREICPDCQGTRLNPQARAVRLEIANRKSQIANPTITAFAEMAVAGAFQWFERLKLKGRDAEIARDILPEIRERLKFLDEVGLGYLQLGRGVPTLSGGESQRIRLAAQLGSNLSGVLYVLDEPTIGLHARDNEQLLAALAKLRARGNSLVVVEHDEETMRRADHVIDLGPGAGVHGGEVVASGTLKELMRQKNSVTGQCLRMEKKFPGRGQRRPIRFDEAAATAHCSVGAGRKKTPAKAKASAAAKALEAEIDPNPVDPLASRVLTLRGARTNNLKDLTVSFPLGRLILVTGVSGSGKSTLVRECLLPVLTEALKRKGRRGASVNDRLSGHETIQAVYEVDQSPIGRTPRSIPATYVGFFNEIRQLFAQTPEARLRGYGPGRFSFNSKEGRCPECEGAGTIKLEMNFLPPAYVRCETCQGSRFNRETLDIEFRGKTIAQVLDLSVEEALEFFASIPRIHRPLQALHDTGLDYLKLGQTSPTLSGGEAQRVKLVSHLLTGLKPQLELPDPRQKRNIFLLEEPTIGLHMADVRRLVEVLQRLVDAGHTVIVIEHNLDLIAEADWIIDLGPEGGEAGGRIVAQGTPEAVAANKQSHTGRFLKALLG